MSTRRVHARPPSLEVAGALRLSPMVNRTPVAVPPVTDAVSPIVPERGPVSGAIRTLNPIAGPDDVGLAELLDVPGALEGAGALEDDGAAERAGAAPGSSAPAVPGAKAWPSKSLAS